MAKKDELRDHFAGLAMAALISAKGSHDVMEIVTPGEPNERAVE